MGFYEDVLKIELGYGGNKCGIGKLLDSDDTEFVEALRKVLADPDIGRIQLSKALKQHGHNMSSTTVSRHQLGQCACLPPTT